MKTPEFLRAYPPAAADPPSSESREEKLVPRYVQAPALRDHGMGPRNLFWGVVLLFLAFLLLVAAILLVGAKAMIYVAACLLTFTALFVLTRLHVFRQRNGGFLGLALVCLIGAAFPLLEKGYSAIENFVRSRPAAGAPVVTLHSDEQGAPLLMQAFALSAPQGDGKQVRVVRDTRVVIEEKPFLIKAGDRFPLIAAKGDQTTFAVRDLLLSLPSSAVEVVDPSALAKGVGLNPSAPAAPGNQPAAARGAAKSNSPSDADIAKIVHSAQLEAMRRYPALAVPDSLENAVYVSTYKTLQDAGSEGFFSDPKWPIVLADLLAKREGWVPGGAPMTTGPAPVLDPPSENALPDATPPDTTPADAPPADGGPADGTPVDPTPVARAQPVHRSRANLPPVNSLDAGDGLPRAGGPSR